jgi:hypothetical protein
MQDRVSKDFRQSVYIFVNIVKFNFVICHLHNLL